MRSCGLDKLSGVEDALGVEGGLDGGVEGSRRWGDGFVPPRFFCKADAVFSCDGAVPCEDLGEKFVEDGAGFFLD